ncbi:MAG: hypothetical protein RLZZ111_143 [Planctomycetota bacterium]|jgi:hypothetical protein
MEQGKPAGTAAAPRSYGFLTAVESAAHGIFGGYLLVDPLGRPLEFHCTAPVKVSRAQQILFGASLPSHLHGQQIGGTLLAEGTLTPDVVLTDYEPLLHVRSHTSLPVALVHTPAVADPQAGAAPQALFVAGGFEMGGARVSTHAADADREHVVREALEQLATAVDLREPFERIRAAIDEAQRH